ncbi:hypothetical protein H9Q09_19555 [Aurantimonas sp. DM33-3]|uniref:hypothetical protein n=1 Tax=Aurantimonas sp. DM33-3 TaxID=2766955 RepID=UPI0016524632|nr:hypothetical protein [Aurantimonas sp. DM33-3]MBC6718384.1 hypothetical protein [Aurantimonas sp. DM33-3]
MPDTPTQLTAEEAVLLDQIFRDGPQQVQDRPAAFGLIDKGFAQWADMFGTLEITETGRLSAGSYELTRSARRPQSPN